MVCSGFIKGKKMKRNFLRINLHWFGQFIFKIILGHLNAPLFLVEFFIRKQLG